MKEIYERLLPNNILREKRRDSFEPQRVNLLGKDSILYGKVAGNTAKDSFFFIT